MRALRGREGRERKRWREGERGETGREGARGRGREKKRGREREREKRPASWAARLRRLLDERSDAVSAKPVICVGEVSC